MVLPLWWVPYYLSFGRRSNMGTEIKVDLEKVKEIEQELSSLQRQVEDRKVNVSFVNAKGSLAEEMINVASSLNEIKAVLTTIMEKTEKIVTGAKDSFENVDAELAELLGLGEN